jgi:patatin-like phospholipase
MDKHGPLPLYQALEEEYVSLHGALPDSHYAQTPEQRLKAIYNRIHSLNQKRAALCISGGGIRSATFALGVIQGLARLKLLREFDYLSTVSGGGYVGSWLSAWIHRDPGGAESVINRLVNKPEAALEPEAKPIQHLRAYSNYLSPQLGLMSADTWTLAAIITRNLILNWTVFFPLLLAALMIPRLCVSFIRVNLPAPLKGEMLTALLGAAFVCGVVAVAYMGIFRPGAHQYRAENYRPFASQGSFLRWCFLPTIGLALLLNIYWGWLRDSYESIETQTTPVLGINVKYPWAFLLFGLLVYFTAWIVFSIWLRRVKLRDILVILPVGLGGGVLLWLAATQIFPKPVFTSYLGETDQAIVQSIPQTEYYVCFGLPLILLLMLLAVTLFVGLASRYTSDEDREWMARFGAWILIAMLGWSAISYLVIFGPYWLMRAGAWAQTAIAAAGGASAIITVILGRSSSTGANENQKDESKQSSVKDLILKMAAPVFMLIFLVSLSLATSALISALKPLFESSPLGIDWHTTWIPEKLSSAMSHLEVIHNTSIRVGLLLFVVFFALGALMSVSININKFSLHSMYRNRLIRAYLGASREKRKPNPFTGFDPDDNIQMHELRPALFHPASFANASALIDRLVNSKDAVSDYLKGRIPKTLECLNDPANSDYKALLDTFIKELNKILDGNSIYDSKRFAVMPLGDETKTLLGQKPSGNNLTVLNRMLLEDAYPAEIKHFRLRRPFHVVNMALNLVHGDNLAWQQRKAESFTASPLHCGSYTISHQEASGCGSYRASKEYGNAKKYDGVEGISLGTAVAISGAAVSPNMGYHSSGVITFLLTLFNARLGWWLGNPGKPGNKVYRRSGPFFSIRPLIAEAFGLTDDKNKYVYLSDGGHFENLALYEMVLRRCHFIVVSDGSQDAECAFDDLGSAIRKARIDFGVRISIDKILIYPRKTDKRGKYYAIGTIHYKEVDGGAAQDGTLIYIKPAICDGEPADVFNYAQTSKTFPHESTADQYFSESQFESYRMLGEHAIRQMSEQWNGENGLAGWADHLQSGYLQPISITPKSSKPEVGELK